MHLRLQASNLKQSFLCRRKKNVRLSSSDFQCRLFAKMILHAFEVGFCRQNVVRPITLQRTVCDVGCSFGKMDELPRLLLHFQNTVKWRLILFSDFCDSHLSFFFFFISILVFFSFFKFNLLDGNQGMLFFSFFECLASTK